MATAVFLDAGFPAFGFLGGIGVTAEGSVVVDVWISLIAVANQRIDPLKLELLLLLCLFLIVMAVCLVVGNKCCDDNDHGHCEKCRRMGDTVVVDDDDDTQVRWDDNRQQRRPLQRWWQQTSIMLHKNLDWLEQLPVVVVVVTVATSSVRSNRLRGDSGGGGAMGITVRRCHRLDKPIMVIIVSQLCSPLLSLSLSSVVCLSFCAKTEWHMDGRCTNVVPVWSCFYW